VLRVTQLDLEVLMKRVALATASAILCASLSLIGANSFETRLSPDRQILQALNRLTFGPRPGDVEEVRRIGLEKWIDLQLHPERIPENPTLEKRLEPLETLRMDSATVLRDYVAPQQMMQQAMIFKPLNQLLPQEQARKLQIGTAEQRKATLDALDPEKRKEVLMMLPVDTIADLPEYKKEADDARKEQVAQRQAEMRKRNPQLMDLLTAEQAQIARNGNADQLKTLMDGLDPEKRLEVASVLPPQSAGEFPDLRREGMRKRAPAQLPESDRLAGKMLSAVYSNRQLEEVLVDFWFNHFNVYENKNPNGAVLSYSSLLTSYERDAIRPHVLGHFKDLLLAVAQHPVMLYYLDNWESMAADTDDRRDIGPFAPAIAAVLIPRLQANRQPHGLNENYGREIMELHTLGVNGGYTQKDVIEVARCFTGWTITKPQSPAFLFSGVMHDDGEKTVLGHKIPAGGGVKDGLTVLDILAHHPSTAHFISKQLAQRFVADDPPPALVERMAQTFLKTDGDLRAVLLTMFDSVEFRSEGAWDAKIKSPFEMVVSAVRATNADAIDTAILTQRVADLGEPLYRKVEPNGYPLTGDGWLGTADLLGRLNFTSSLIMGKVPGVKVDTARWNGKTPDEISRDLLDRPAAPETMAVISAGFGNGNVAPTAIAQLILGSPEFNKR
jgi:uncharacterized protein (DUF1800 family)